MRYRQMHLLRSTALYYLETKSAYNIIKEGIYYFKKLRLQPLLFFSSSPRSGFRETCLLTPFH